MIESIAKNIWLRKVLLANNFKVEENQINLLYKYVDLLIEKNISLNLVSRKDIDNIWENHILHSISILFNFSFPKNSTILDLGSGGGLPGIPIKILRPDINLTLVDSIKKKVSAIDEFIQKLVLTQTKAVWSRAEDLRKGHLNHYDTVISRAVAPLKELISWSYPLIKKTGATSLSSTLVALKGGDLESEIKHAKLYDKYKEILVNDLMIKGIDSTILQDKKFVVVRF
jgi:16S rRNA (guanine527-N7)-methyltransferase